MICVLQQALVPRLNITAEALSTCFGPKWWWGIRGAAERIASQPQILDTGDYFKEMQSLRSEIKELKREIKKVRKEQTPHKSPGTRAGTKRRHIESD